MPQSALVGEPPKTDDDYDIVKALMLRLHLNLNAAKGIHLVPPPLHPQSDTRAPQILTASIICITLIVFITGSRLSIRAFGPNVKWGWDDWLIIPGAVNAIRGAFYDRYGADCMYLRGLLSRGLQRLSFTRRLVEQENICIT